MVAVLDEVGQDAEAFGLELDGRAGTTEFIALFV
jgi:hypothetical protein